MSINPITFTNCSIKTLTAVEADPTRSNQHEFQGVASLKSLFGSTNRTLHATFSIRGQSNVYDADLQWYDARANNSNRSAEYRLYFQGTPVMDAACQGDTIIIGYKTNGDLHCELIQQNRLNVANWQQSQNYTTP